MNPGTPKLQRLPALVVSVFDFIQKRCWVMEEETCGYFIALSKGKSGLDSIVWSWEKPENISHEKLNQKLNAKIENM